MTQYNDTYAILLNGPPGLGKTKAMEFIEDNLPVPFRFASCKGPLHTATMAFFGIGESQYFGIYEDGALKKIPFPEFRVTLAPEDQVAFRSDYLSLPKEHSDRYATYSDDGLQFSLNLTIREAMIYVSEVLMKPRLGVTIFGERRAGGLIPGELVIDDSTAAFEVDGEIRADELCPLIEKIGQDNILLLRLHREGFDFSGDSRRYIPDGICTNTVDMTNVDELEFYREVYNTICKFLVNKGVL